MSNFHSLSEAAYYQSEATFHMLLLRDRIRLSEIPFPLRASRSIYVGALRVSQHFGRFVDDVQIIMDDVLEIAKHRESYLYQHELHDIISLLHSYLSNYDFGGLRSEREFKESIYEPFAERLGKLLLAGLSEEI